MEYSRDRVYKPKSQDLPIFLEAENEQATAYRDARQSDEIHEILLTLERHREAKETIMTLFEEVRDIYRELQRVLLQARRQLEELGPGAFSRLLTDTQQVTFCLRQSLQRASEKLSDSESKLLEDLGIVIDDTSGNDIDIL
ncbi:hypothetical protein N7540_005592 [Penicillium herquei]|nr:hypothetical protein N7540_005592 [Penicillium herquei]